RDRDGDGDRPPIVDSMDTMTIILNGRVECMRSHQQRTTLQSAGYQYLKTKLVVVLAETASSGGSDGERAQAAVLTRESFKRRFWRTEGDVRGGGSGGGRNCDGGGGGRNHDREDEITNGAMRRVSCFICGKAAQP
ncbi:hypothetical protein HID58_096308, partial [Brassica napus]